ncbi:MAG: glyoxalase, partial [Polyangiaceae bacterium]|nr:glyoxalase [Polyangiaceae bacterium]
MLELSTAQPARHPSPTSKAIELAYVVFERPDLDRAEAFLTDFGLLPAARTRDVLYLRARSSAPYCYRIHRGPTPRFVGAGFRVRSRSDLEKLSQLDGASAIKRSGHP